MQIAQLSLGSEDRITNRQIEYNRPQEAPTPPSTKSKVLATRKLEDNSKNRLQALRQETLRESEGQDSYKPRQ